MMAPPGTSSFACSPVVSPEKLQRKDSTPLSHFPKLLTAVGDAFCVLFCDGIFGGLEFVVDHDDLSIMGAAFVEVVVPFLVVFFDWWPSSAEIL